MSDNEAHLSPKRADAEEGSSDLQTVLIKELTDLRNDQGATLPRVGKCRSLIRIGEMWRQGGRTDAEDNAKAARDLLEQSIHDLHDRERGLLLAQFGFTFNQTSRVQRDQAYLADLVKRGEKGSTPSLDRWSKVGITQLAQRIVDRLDRALIEAPLKATSDPDVLEDRAQDHKGSDQEGLLIQSTEEFLRFGPNRILHDRLCIQHAIAMETGEHTRPVGYEYFSDRRDGVIEIIPEYGCVAAAGPTYTAGFTQLNLHIPEVLQQGETHVLVYRVLFHTDQAVSPPFISWSPLQDRDHETVHVQFYPDAIPVDVWAFAGINHYELLQPNALRQEQLRHDHSRFVSKRFNNVKAGLTYGITWDWES